MSNPRKPSAGWYADWAEHHCTVFGMRFENELRMLLSWQEVFSRHGFSETELLAATEWMMTESAPTRPADHLRLIQQAIHRQRAEKRESERMARREHERRDVCRFCNNSGMVVVPHARSMHGGEWVYPWWTAAVACRCSAGQATKEDERTRGRAMMDLNTYELEVNCAWLEQMEERLALRSAEDQATNEADGLFKISGKLAKRWGLD